MAMEALPPWNALPHESILPRRSRGLTQLLQQQQQQQQEKKKEQKEKKRKCRPLAPLCKNASVCFSLDFGYGDTTKHGVRAGAADWDTDASSSLYRIHEWGRPYFTINRQGHVAVLPMGSEDGSSEIDLVEIVEDLRQRSISLPFVIRFSDILQHRLTELQDCFTVAREKFGYKSTFQGVFPIKCNYDCYLLDNIVKFGRPFSFGLEVGSKPELLIAVTKLIRNNNALLVCNGYKDSVYIETVLFARKLKINAIVVLEQIKELDLVIKASEILSVRPVIGVRARLGTHHSGHWGSTSGDNGKFGLTISDIIKVVYRLEKEGMLDCLQLLHFHIGSQVSCISTIKEAMREASHIYCELALMGAAMGYIDVGGGLGIDYNGTRSASPASTNYTMQNYANDVVAAIVDACVLKRVPHPIIVSESGRALASHQSVLVFDVLGATIHSQKTSLEDLDKDMSSDGASTEEGTQDPGAYLISTFREVYDGLDERNLQEAYNDSKQFKMEAARLFKLGGLSLKQRAQADAIYNAICHRILLSFKQAQRPDEMIQLERTSAAVYHINLSVFRSVPDAWAIGQMFPIMPLQRLDEMPELQAVLADLTCDSDGKIDCFVGGQGKAETTLPVHQLHPHEPYYMGLFLAGVYQEVMGSAHNLFGATNVVYVKADLDNVDGRGGGGGKRGKYVIEKVKWGDTMRDILGTKQGWGADDLLHEFHENVNYCVSSGYLTQAAAQALVTYFQTCLNSYTYLT